MNKTRIFFTALLSIVLIGCASTPSPETLANAYFGSPPESDEFAQSTMAQYIEQSLKDPESAQYRNFRSEGKGWYGGGVYKRHFGWRYSVEVNAKNSFGGYVGFRQYLAVFQDNTLTYLLRMPPVNNTDLELPDVLVNGATGI